MYFILLFILMFPSYGFCDIIAPDGTIKKYHGPKIFYTESLKIDYLGDTTRIKLITNFPLDEVDYDISDIELETDDGISLAIQMQKPIRGNILKNPDWTTSKIFEDIDEDCKDLDGNHIRVLAKNGKFVGKALFEEEKFGEKYLVKIYIPSRLIKGKIKVSWGTALCGNCLVEDSAYILKKETQNKYVQSPIYFDLPKQNPVISYYSPPTTQSYPFGWSDTGDYPWWYDIITPKPPTPPAPVPIPNLFLSSFIIILRIFKKIKQ
jgi:hypothetical protein